MKEAVPHLRFSVIVPTFNRPAALAACLESLAQLDYPAGAWELIVVNDGGENSFTAVTDRLKTVLPLQLITGDHKGPAAARNTGAQRAQGEYLAFTDDDCRVTPDWLRAFATGFADGRWHALGGQTLSPFLQNRAERAWQHLTNFLNIFMQDDAGNALLLISNNVAYRRETFARLGGFNETFPLAAAEDMELSYRLLAAGHRQCIWPEAKVWHYHHLSAWGHVRQQFRYGRGGYYFNRALMENPSPRLRSLYLNPAFLPSLRQSMQRADLSYLARGMVMAGQYAYKAGLRYQTWQAARR
jgi:GT2 family glycosyltransferase